MGTLHVIGVSSGDMAAAIAEAVIHDIRVNGLGIQGFPQITVAHPSKEAFAIRLTFDTYSSDLTITADEAKRAVATLKAGRGHDEAIFRRVQDAAVELEAAHMRAVQAG
jgi:hypothetical protein